MAGSACCNFAYLSLTRAATTTQLYHVVQAAQAACAGHKHYTHMLVSHSARVSAACCRFYLNSFYPPDQVTVPYSLVEAAVGLANVAAAPLAASLLMLDGSRGMHGWQWCVGQWLTSP